MRIGLIGAILFLTARLEAEDHILVIGGGPSPNANQISIEKNVVFFRSTMSAGGWAGQEPQVLFASGPSDKSDVCYDGSSAIPRVYQLIGDLLDEKKSNGLSFRPHDVGAVAGPTDRTTVLDTLSGFAKKLQAGDRLLVYVTGHGGKGDPVTNGILHTWRGDKIAVKDFATVLDQFLPEVEVVVVMVQCYSGSFANIIFSEGDPNKPLTKHRRAGFFATVEDRPAAGCTADTKIEDYREYSTSFLAALGSKDRTGATVEAPDIDANGRICFAEAHAYTLVHSSTIDISNTTSDRFLTTQTKLDDKDDALASANAPLEDLLEWADPYRRWTLEQLAKEHELDPQRPLEDAQKKATQATEDRRDIQKKVGRHSGTISSARRVLRTALLQEWPVLQSPWNPQAHDLLRESAEDVVRFIESHRAYEPWSKKVEEVKQLKEKDLGKERDWAKLQRFILVAKSAAREENLRRSGDMELAQQFENIQTVERSSLGSTSDTP